MFLSKNMGSSKIMQLYLSSHHKFIAMGPIIKLELNIFIKLCDSELYLFKSPNDNENRIHKYIRGYNSDEHAKIEITEILRII